MRLHLSPSLCFHVAITSPLVVEKIKSMHMELPLSSAAETQDHNLNLMHLIALHHKKNSRESVCILYICTRGGVAVSSIFWASHIAVVFLNPFFFNRIQPTSFHEPPHRERSWKEQRPSDAFFFFFFVQLAALCEGQVRAVYLFHYLSHEHDEKYKRKENHLFPSHWQAPTKKTWHFFPFITESVATLCFAEVWKKKIPLVHFLCFPSSAELNVCKWAEIIRRLPSTINYAHLRACLMIPLARQGWHNVINCPHFVFFYSIRGGK